MKTFLANRQSKFCMSTIQSNIMHNVQYVVIFNKSFPLPRFHQRYQFNIRFEFCTRILNQIDHRNFVKKKKNEKREKRKN